MYQHANPSTIPRHSRSCRTGQSRWQSRGHRIASLGCCCACLATSIAKYRIIPYRIASRAPCKSLGITRSITPAALSVGGRTHGHPHPLHLRGQAVTVVRICLRCRVPIGIICCRNIGVSQSAMVDAYYRIHRRQAFGQTQFIAERNGVVPIRYLDRISGSRGKTCAAGIGSHDRQKLRPGDLVLAHPAGLSNHADVGCLFVTLEAASGDIDHGQCKQCCREHRRFVHGFQNRFQLRYRQAHTRLLVAGFEFFQKSDAVLEKLPCCCLL